MTSRSNAVLKAHFEGMKFNTGRRICQDFELQLSSGEVVTLQAPNGWGKSVLLRLLSGWAEDVHGLAVHGEIVVQSMEYRLPRDFSVFAEHARRCSGAVFNRLGEESFGVTVGEELEQIKLRYERSFAELVGPARHIYGRFSDIPEDTRMDGVAKGLRQVLAVVDVFADVASYDYLILDEPTCYLADDLVKVMLDLIVWAREINPAVAVLVASHDRRFVPVSGRIRSLRPNSAVSRYVSVDLGMLRSTLRNFQAHDPVGFRVVGTPVTQEGRKLPFDFDLDVPAGESLLVVGPNGTGKSTLLHTLAGFLRVQGHYKIKTRSGRRVRRRRLLRDHVGIVFQEPQEYEFRGSVGEILEDTSCVPTSLQSQWVQFVRSFLDAFNIFPRQDPRTLSTGQLRMVWLVSQFGWSSTWLLDEITAGLDEDATLLAEHFLSSHVEYGGSIIAVHSHNRKKTIRQLQGQLGGPDRCRVMDLCSMESGSE